MYIEVKLLLQRWPTDVRFVLIRTFVGELYSKGAILLIRVRVSLKCYGKKQGYFTVQYDVSKSLEMSFLTFPLSKD